MGPVFAFRAKAEEIGEETKNVSIFFKWENEISLGNPCWPVALKEESWVGAVCSIFFFLGERHVSWLGGGMKAKDTWHSPEGIEERWTNACSLNW